LAHLLVLNVARGFVFYFYFPFPDGLSAWTVLRVGWHWVAAFPLDGEAFAASDPAGMDYMYSS
jgi:hypothetical protein